MMMMVHHDNHRRPLSSSERDDADAAAATTPDGPTCYRPPNTHNISPYDVAAAAAAAPGSSRGGTGGMMTCMGFPFTNAQWKELERQAMIYKYMVASLPVPRELLFPAFSTTSSAAGSAISQSPLGGGGFNLRLSNSTDPEPGRCKRTDGKKWRCSRDVAPDQKYCERHMHRGRPRSRKHVEVHANNTTTTTTTAAPAKRVCHDINQPPPPAISPATVSVSNADSMNKNVCPTQFIGSTLQPYHHHSAATFNSINSVSSDRESRGMEWLMMKGEPVQMATSDAEWHHLMQSKQELSSKIPFFGAANSSSIYAQRSEEVSFLNLNSYTSFNAGADQQDNECNLFLNPDVVSLENPMLEETPRCFLDAWSKTVIDDKDNNSSGQSSGQLSPSSLTLSMGGYKSINEEMGRTQMSLGSNGNGMKPRLSNWLTPASWVASAPGGPLAEVLKPTTSAASNPSSPIATATTNGELGSPLATTVSSPSGVLHKTFASLSDSSGNSSPTLASSRAKPEIVSKLWLNQNKAS